jgi:hypothetical protein
LHFFLSLESFPIQDPTGEDQLYKQGLTETLDENFSLSQYLEGSPNDLMRRFINIILHRISLNVKGLIIALETPRHDGKVDILHFSFGQLSLSKSDRLSLSSAANLSFSDMNRIAIQKMFEIFGGCRMELFSIQPTEINSSFHLRSRNAEAKHPAICIIDGSTIVNIQVVLHPTLDFHFKTQIPKIWTGFHSSQLFSISNMVNRYHDIIANHIVNFEFASKISSPKLSIAISNSQNSNLDQSIARSRINNIGKVQYEAKDESDDDTDDESELLEEENNFEPIHSPQITFDLSPIPNPTLFRFELSIPSIEFLYIPSDAFDGESPFLSISSFSDPCSLHTHFIKSSFNNVSIINTTDSQHVSAELNIDEHFVLRTSERPYIPSCCKEMIPETGYYVQNILTTYSTTEGQSFPVAINHSRSSGLILDLFELHLNLPLGIPKLCSNAIEDINRAFPNKKPSESLPTDISGNAAPSHSSQVDPNQEFNLDHQINPNPKLEDEPKQLLFESLLLGESLVFESGAYTRMRINIGLLVVNLEVPLPHDLRFTLPLRRQERLKLEMKDLSCEINTSDALCGSENPHRTLSSSFSNLNVYMERNFFKIPVSKSSLTSILTLEGKSADSLEISPENFRFEWRDKPAPSSILSPESIHNAPFSVPTSDIGTARQALSRQEFQNLSSTPSKLCIIITVHMTVINLSSHLYSFVMDVYDEYLRLSRSEIPIDYHKETESAILVDFRSRFGLLHLHTINDSSSSNNTGFTYDVQLENVRALQTSSFYGQDKSLLAIEVERVDLPSLVESMRLDRPDPQIHLSYAQSSEAFLRSSSKHHHPSFHQESTYLVEIRDCNISWTFSDLWPYQISAIFTRIERSEYQMDIFTKVSSSVSIDEKHVNNGKNYYNNNKREEKSTFLFNVIHCGIAIWGSVSSPINDSSMATKLLASPQLVIIPQQLHISIDLNSWLSHAFLDRAEIFTCLDRFGARDTYSFDRIGIKGVSTAREYWVKRKHEHAGIIGTSTATFVALNNVSESSIKCGLELNTSVSQIITLQLLYNVYSQTMHANESNMKDKSNQQEKISSQKIFINRPSTDDNEEEEEEHIVSSGVIQSLPNIRSPPIEPQVHFEPGVSKNLPLSIVSEDYIPSRRQVAPLKSRFSVLPFDIVWKLRSDIPLNGEKTIQNIPCIELHFSQLEVRYDLDENDSSLLEVSFKTLDGYSQLSGDRGMHIFGFDQNASHFRRRHLYFTLSSCMAGMESSAPRSTYSILSSSYSEGLGEYLEGIGGLEDDPNGGGGKSKLSRFRLVVLPLQLRCTVQTFQFIHNYYRSYAKMIRTYDSLPTNDTEPSFVQSLFDVIGSTIYSHIPASSSNETESSILQKPSSPPRSFQVGPSVFLSGQDTKLVVLSPPVFFKSFYVSDLHLRLNLPGINDAKIRLPSVISMNVLGWRGVADELTSAYTPFVNEALTSVITSFPGLKLVKTVGRELWQLVRVPMEEARSGRSVTYAFLTTFGSGVKNVTTEAIGLTAEAVSATHKGIGVIAAYFDQRDVEDINDDQNQNQQDQQDQDHQDHHHHVPPPIDFADGASQGVQSVVKSVVAAKENMKAPFKKYQRDDGSILALLKDTTLAVPATIILPIGGIVSAAGAFLHGTAAHMRADHTTQHDLPLRSNGSPSSSTTPFIPEEKEE